MIGIVWTLSDHLDFKYVDPVTFNVEWEITLPKSANIPSLYGLSNNAQVSTPIGLAPKSLNGYAL